MRLFLSASAGLFLAALPSILLDRGHVTNPGNRLPADPIDAVDPIDPGDNQVCATGCAAVPADSSKLSLAEYRSLLAAFAAQPPNATSEALETLLFHGARSREWIDAHGLGGLDAERATLLETELTRTHAWLDVRILDEDGVERLRLGRKRVPLGEKRHLFPDHTQTLQPPEVSGTVKRVGLGHLWARL